MELTNAEQAAIVDRFNEWRQLKECYAKAEELKDQGKTEITISIDLLLLAREIPKSVEKFYSEMFRKACGYKAIELRK